MEKFAEVLLQPTGEENEHKNQRRKLHSVATLGPYESGDLRTVGLSEEARRRNLISVNARPVPSALR